MEKIDKSVVKERMPFYLECFKCGKTIEGLTIKSVIHSANSEGWAVDCYGNVFCGDCLKEIPLK